MGKTGKVYLIGAGPGDKGLMTLKGKKCLEISDVVIYDYLVNEELLNYCHERSEKIYVGKKASQHTLPQAEINELLVYHAKQGKVVSRLKGGDPFVFGRGGEEALELRENNIPFEIVPGITAAVAASAYAGIPVTHRGFTSTMALITGHEDPLKEHSAIQWDKIATGVGTLVFYMGVKNLNEIRSKLIENGRSRQTPVAVIRWGTMNHQQTLTGTLEDIAEKANKDGFSPPSIIVVGEVVGLREKLRWFDSRALSGTRIIITRSRAQASDLREKLQSLGAQTLEFPTINLEPVKDFTLIDRAISEISAFSWIIFTSVNGVEIFFTRLYEHHRFDSRVLAGVKIAAIGTETGERLRKFGIFPDLVPDKFTSESTIKAFESLEINFSGQKILCPGSEISRDYIPMKLKEMGANVLSIPLYKNTIPEYTIDEIKGIFKKLPDLVTFTSSSTVKNFIEILRKTGMENMIDRIKGASIGPVTTETARELNVRIVIEADVQTIDGLVDSIQNFFSYRT